MSLIHWRDEYAVNVLNIDKDHKKLVELINQLFEARREGHGDEVLRSLFDELTTYCSQHFHREEEDMARLDYPNYPHHKKQHDDLSRQTQALQERLSEDMSGLSNDTFKFLRTWLLDHIVEEDKKLGPFFNQRGVF